VHDGISTYGYGAPRRPGEGLRIGVTRLWPRGVAKARAAADGYFDLWLPLLAPSPALFKRRPRDAADARSQARYDRAYRREMAAPAPRQAIALLAAVSRRAPISLGCSCHPDAEDPAAGYCHRFTLAELVRQAAA
jgi:uncharacterized protein YeaO (DUF488 family)